MTLSTIMVGGFHWVNLVNTIYMQNGEKTDFFEDQTHLLEWLVACNLLRSQPKNMEPIREKLITLRGIFHSIIQDIMNHQAINKKQIEQLNHFGDSLSLHVRLELNEDQVTRKFEAKTSDDLIVFEILNSFMETFEQVPMTRLRKCDHTDCILYFADISKGGRRRWCSMESCGNREKASNFYARKKERT